MRSSTTRPSTCARSRAETALSAAMSARAITTVLAGVLAMLVLAAALASCATGASTTVKAPATAGASAAAGAPGAAGAPAATTPAGCPAGAEVLANTAGLVAQRIYAGEAHSSETAADKRQIESFAPLLNAVQSGERAAIHTAVHSLVYSHTHIVRLRVSRGSELLYDEGGPYILAPVGGTLRSHGKEIGRFVFSVQDDLGYVKLVTRFIGAPMILRTASGQVPIEGLLSPGPASIPDHGPVTYRGTAYQAYSFNVDAYPSGRLRVSLLLPIAHSLTTKSCGEIKAAELGLVAQRVSRRFTLSSSTFPPYIRLVRTLTNALVYVRAGSRTLAGSTPTTPPKLPSSGKLRWHGVEYQVSSSAVSTSAGQARVYVLASH
jgi:hypothetical protein